MACRRLGEDPPPNHPCSLAGRTLSLSLLTGLLPSTYLFPLDTLDWIYPAPTQALKPFIPCHSTSRLRLRLLKPAFSAFLETLPRNGSRTGRPYSTHERGELRGFSHIWYCGGGRRGGESNPTTTHHNQGTRADIAAYPLGPRRGWSNLVGGSSAGTRGKH